MAKKSVSVKFSASNHEGKPDNSVQLLHCCCSFLVAATAVRFSLSFFLVVAAAASLYIVCVSEKKKAFNFVDVFQQLRLLVAIMAPVKRKGEKPTEGETNLEERVSETGALEREETHETPQVEVSVGHEKERDKNEQSEEKQEDKENEVDEGDDEVDKDEETREETEEDNENFAEGNEENDEGDEEEVDEEE
ncbi:uncharacterized protein LOC132607689 [Lycium barbarum]|uniref:uncharacterized protein LOC132607689 n=1 Tax=Lycium barbarum TaxID=112863 RepID=UPI00293EC34F|nr:uncharacterized protein LOC132607689 [Lycium barbarum]